jgi:AraC family transcriptional regulator, transcriptional activator of pobA
MLPVGVTRSASDVSVATGRELAVDRLPEGGPAIEVRLVEDASFGAATIEGPREPHRHDYHELIWTRRGEGEHLIDGEVSLVRPRTVTIIGRGQVHVFERATGLYGAVVRFGDELLHGERLVRAAWLLGRRSSRTVELPPADVPRLEALIEMLAAESRRPPDGCSLDLEAHLVSVILLLIERWYDASRTGRREADDAEEQLYRRFVDVLERDYARHHDVRHYADALRVPPAALSRALAQVTGQGTKELVTDRIMTEAARLLRYSDLTVGEVAYRVGFADQMYFSRAFRRHSGASPSAYRERARGRGSD